MEQENLGWMTKLYYKYLFADNYEAVVTTSEELIPVMSRSFLVERERVKVWGQPRNDKLFEKINVREQMQKIFQKKSFRNLILCFYMRLHSGMMGKPDCFRLRNSTEKTVEER